MERINFENLEAVPYKPLAAVSRKIAAEGTVLLKNEGNVLPLKKEDAISLFGRTQIDYYKSGTGSGGLVRVDYAVNILEGIRNNPKLSLNEELVAVYENWLKNNPFDEGSGWAKEPWCQIEMVPDEEIVKSARKKSEIAVIVLGRTAGEDRDNEAKKGSWYLTDKEEALLEIVSKYFEKTVVLLNTGNIIDTSWAEKYNIKSVLYIWQGGQEGGNAAADILSGSVNPSGRLSDTIAWDIHDYPSVKNFGNDDFNIYKEDIFVGYRYFETFAKDKVMYPFGFGLSYTSFDINVKSIDEKCGYIIINSDVKNTGKLSGKEVVEVYFEAPQGLLGKSARELCAFVKTKELKPGESEETELKIKIDSMCCYDDSGITGNKSSYILEKGDYNIYLGKCVRCAEKIYTHQEAKTRLIKKCTEAMAPVRDFEIMHPKKPKDGYEISYKKASKRTVDYDKRIKAGLPKAMPYTGDKGIKLIDVKEGRYTLDEFTAQLSDTELACLVRGEGMCSPKVRPGSAGAVGGTTKALSDFGIPIAALHDGPSGIRMDSGEKATSMPNGTAIACSWNTDLAFCLYENLSSELLSHNIDSILGPGLNLHRVPLNGRNFEYLSEDPYLTGTMGSALAKGVASKGNSATIKHFAANSQEHRRRDIDAVVSERALRELYLKCFEIPVVSGGIKSIMTSYNPVNGIWSANNYDLNTVILRNEWGYDGYVMTDWWPKLSKDQAEGGKITLKALVEGQNDVYMPTSDSLNFNDDIEESLKDGSLTRGQLERNAKNILNYLLSSHTLERFIKFGTSITDELIEGIKDKETTSIENAKANTVYTFKADKPGRHKAIINYRSSEAPVTQMTISLNLDGNTAGAITVNGTDGNKKTTVIEFDTMSCTMHISLDFPEKLIAIQRMQII